jgi:hypothetical protein
MYIRPLLAKSFSSLIFSGIIRCDPPSAGIFSYRPFADSVAVFTTILKNAENVNVFYHAPAGLGRRCGSPFGTKVNGSRRIERACQVL